ALQPRDPVGARFLLEEVRGVLPDQRRGLGAGALEPAGKDAAEQIRLLSQTTDLGRHLEGDHAEGPQDVADRGRQGAVALDLRRRGELAERPLVPRLEQREPLRHEETILGAGGIGAQELEEPARCFGVAVLERRPELLLPRAGGGRDQELRVGGTPSPAGRRGGGADRGSARRLLSRTRLLRTLDKVAFGSFALGPRLRGTLRGFTLGSRARFTLRGFTLRARSRFALGGFTLGSRSRFTLRSFTLRARLRFTLCGFTLGSRSRFTLRGFTLGSRSRFTLRSFTLRARSRLALRARLIVSLGAPPLGSDLPELRGGLHLTRIVVGHRGQIR